MLTEQRYDKILRMMQADGSVRVAELKKVMGVSPETIRRDLENLEEKGLIRRTRGGAFLNEKGISKEKQKSYVSFLQRKAEHAVYKSEIAQTALDFIEEGQSIALDSGTTALELAKVLDTRFHNLTVVTNSCAVINALSEAEGITVIATGGVYRPEEKAFVSDMAGLIFSKLSIDTFFLTTCGISVEKGVTYQRVDEVCVQEKMMEASERTVVIADSSKLGNNSLVKMCDLDRISMIITDSSASEEQITAFAEAGITVHKPRTA